jgi:hypothetical protein
MVSGTSGRPPGPRVLETRPRARIGPLRGAGALDLLVPQSWRTGRTARRKRGGPQGSGRGVRRERKRERRIARSGQRQWQHWRNRPRTRCPDSEPHERRASPRGRGRASGSKPSRRLEPRGRNVPGEANLGEADLIAESLKGGNNPKRGSPGPSGPGPASRTAPGSGPSLGEERWSSDRGELESGRPRGRGDGGEGAANP